jgi:hypothetical protein
MSSFNGWMTINDIMDAIIMELHNISKLVGFNRVVIEL